MISLNDVLEARHQLASVIKPTDLIWADYLSELLGKEIYFKPENLQITGSFKVRGAYCNLLGMLKRLPRQKTVICASAGNHAQGVAWAGRKLGLAVKVVMPSSTPLIKLEAVKQLGAEVFLCGETFEEAILKAREICQHENCHFVHPFDDELIIAGQGTIGLEIFDELPRVGTVIVPVGGGGLISGISLALKESAKKEKLKGPKIVGVHSYSKIAEGIYIKELGDIPKSLIKKYVKRIVAVKEEEIELAILTLMEKSKIIVEGAGAVGVAALLAGKIKNAPEPIVVVLSGGNIDISLLGKIILSHQV